MNAAIPRFRRTLPAWLSAVAWLSVFLSPTAYFLLLLIASELQIPKVPMALIASLFFLIPAGALIFCEWVVWTRSRTAGGKIGGMVFTLLAMLLQFGIILVVLRAILVTRIGYGQ